MDKPKKKNITNMKLYAKKYSGWDGAKSIAAQDIRKVEGAKGVIGYFLELALGGRPIEKIQAKNKEWNNKREMKAYKRKLKQRRNNEL